MSRTRKHLFGLLLGALALIGDCEAVLATQASFEVHGADGKPVPAAVILLHALDRQLPAHPPVQASMDQINRAFVPDVLVIPVGSYVTFPNTDTTRHQVYSFSPARRFQLPLYSGTPYPPVQFDRVGVVTLGCNIHDSMLAYIVVTDAQVFGSTDARGVWMAHELPPGRYRLEIWHPRLPDPASTVEQEVTVADAARVDLPVRLDRALRPPALQPHPHSWDSY